MIFETIITSINAAGAPHVTPFGVRYEGDHVLISPYKPSTTLTNILLCKQAVMNMTDDVRVFAAALTNRQAWQLQQANQVNGFRLANCLQHVELALIEVRDDAVRPQLVMQKIYAHHHRPFNGFNRAQAAVIEMAVLVSRLHMLPQEKIQSEIQYLQIAIDKTAGEHELLAWTWLLEKTNQFYATSEKREQS
ncbi:MAG: tetrahydromethanopterin synthesis protein [Methylotenera sp.]|nr:MAG: tetrahydromethanopterin synthesis protein [Methylotenera sp.]